MKQRLIRRLLILSILIIGVLNCERKELSNPIISIEKFYDSYHFKGGRIALIIFHNQNKSEVYHDYFYAKLNNIYNVLKRNSHNSLLSEEYKRLILTFGEETAETYANNIGSMLLKEFIKDCDENTNINIKELMVFYCNE